MKRPSTPAVVFLFPFFLPGPVQDAVQETAVWSPFFPPLRRRLAVIEPQRGGLDFYPPRWAAAKSRIPSPPSFPPPLLEPLPLQREAAILLRLRESQQRGGPSVPPFLGSG